jgi:signal transduction histidine kinase
LGRGIVPPSQRRPDVRFGWVVWMFALFIADGTSFRLIISGTGTGMSDEVRDRIFEPFFSTKPVGQGTGLGIRQVYGFTKQSGGDIVVVSEQGEGTILTIVLPREPADTQSSRHTMMSETDKH